MSNVVEHGSRIDLSNKVFGEKDAPIDIHFADRLFNSPKYSESTNTYLYINISIKKVYLNLAHVDTVPATRLNRPFVHYHKILHYCRQHYYQEAISSSENYCMCVPHAGTLQKKMKLVQVYCTGTGTRVQEYSSDLRAVSIGIRILQYQNVSVGFVARTCMVETTRLNKVGTKGLIGTTNLTKWIFRNLGQATTGKHWRFWSLKKRELPVGKTVTFALHSLDWYSRSSICEVKSSALPHYIDPTTGCRRAGGPWCSEILFIVKGVRLCQFVIFTCEWRDDGCWICSFLRWKRRWLRQHNIVTTDSTGNRHRQGCTLQG